MSTETEKMDYTKYDKMRKVGMNDDTVRNRMKMDGFKSDDINRYLNGVNAPSSEQVESKQDMKEAEESKDIDETGLNDLSRELQDLYNHKAKYEINDETGSITFYPTPDLEPSDELLDTSPISFDEAVTEAGCGKIESTSDSKIKVMGSSQAIPFGGGRRQLLCSFVKGALDAWSNHYPFRYLIMYIYPHDIIL